MILDIPRMDDKLVRVFAINATADETTGRLKTQSKAQLVSQLLGHPVTEGGFDLVALDDLEGVGFGNYLIEGWDIPAKNLTDTRAKLDALEGYALVVFSSAFAARDISLTIGPELTLIGTYAEAPVDMHLVALESDAAQPYTGQARVSEVPATSRRGGSAVVLAFALLVGLVLWWALR